MTEWQTVVAGAVRRLRRNGLAGGGVALLILALAPPTAGAYGFTGPLAWGLPQRLDVYFSDGRWDNAPVFDLPAGRTDIRPLLRFDTATPLRSGWAWGQEYLQGGVLAAEADVGAGRLTFFGTDITFRAQAHGSFKLLFNSLLQAGADPE